jgi:hypothetical protein
MVQACAGTKAEILDTRKTVPGLRLLDKWAVAIGGGCNHRIGLYDMIMIKDNHIAAAMGLTAAVKLATEYVEVCHIASSLDIDGPPAVFYLYAVDARLAAPSGHICSETYLCAPASKAISDFLVKHTNAFAL